MSKESQPKTTGNNKVDLAAVAATAAVVVSLLALFQSCSANRLAKEANDLSRESVRIAESELATASVPTLQATYYPAYSISLDAPEDSAFIEAFGLSPTLLRSAYWRTIQPRASTSEPRYLFIVISNYGPGTATDLRITGEFAPKEGAPLPGGLFEFEGDVPVLPPGRFLAFLVDVLAGYDPVADLAHQAGTHFASVHLVVECETVIGTPCGVQADLPGLPPALMEP